ncbi:MAG: S8 family serine peptidase, partial [Pseudomonadota bacterium]
MKSGSGLGVASSSDLGLAQSVGFNLANLYSSYMAHLAAAGDPRAAASTFAAADAMTPVAGGYVTIDFSAKAGAGATLLADLVALGLQSATVHGDIVSGRFPVMAIGSLDELGALNHARPSYMRVNAGAADNQAGPAINTPAVYANYGSDGSGVVIGVLSDSFDASASAGDRYVDNIASGDLPAGIVVLEEIADPFDAIDEGRAMAQLIHDIAPGASIAFHSAFNGLANFASGILELAAFSDVIVDDVIYLAEPFFQDGIVAQAVDAAYAAGVAYFSSAGNAARQSYESEFRAVTATIAGTTGTFHDFDPGAGVDTTQAFTLAPGESITLSFQWDEPYFGNGAGSPGSASDVDIFVLDAAGNIVAGGFDYNVGADPVEIFSFANATGATATFRLAINLYEGPAPNTIKYVDFDGGTDDAEYATASGASFGHASAEGALGVGAAYWALTPAFGFAPPQLEFYSSAGSELPILFNPDGTPTLQYRNRVDITAPDGGNTTFFGGDTLDDPDAFPNFFGTSAAAPNAAALAALFLSEDPTLAPDEIYNALISTAADILARDDGSLVGAGFDPDSGSGLIQADAAFALLFGSVAAATAGDDSIYGSAGGDLAHALAGVDTLFGVGGRDTLFGGEGDDILLGGNGNDSLNGGAGADHIDGGAGADVLYGGAGAFTDTLIGGADIDVAVINGYSRFSLAGAMVTLINFDSANPASGSFEIQLSDGSAHLLSGIERLQFKDDFIELLLGTDQSDALIVATNRADVYLGAGDDTVMGGAGNDFIVGPFVNPGNPGDPGYFVGDPGDKTVDAGGGDDAVSVGDGDDFLQLGAGNDNAAAGAGLDTIDGGAGDDQIFGGDGADWIGGGDGFDTILFVGASGGGVVVDLGAGAGSGADAEGDVYSNIEGVIGSGHADFLIGSASDEDFRGGAGDDTLIGRAGADYLYGGDGFDAVDYGNAL